MALCFTFLLLMLLQTQLTLHAKLEDAELRELTTFKLNNKYLIEDKSGKRLELHEVHLGPNPISNSFKEEVPDLNLQTAP